jgi:tRNA(fMet)-specific endonuclease VapC
MAQLIDTSVFVAMDRQVASLDGFVELMGDEPFAIASITASELLAGVYGTVPASRQEGRRGFVETVLDRVPVLTFDLEAARMHARLFVELSAAGRMIGANDLEIAATALTYGYAVQTHNLRHFERVPGLVVNAPSWQSLESHCLTGVAAGGYWTPTSLRRRRKDATAHVGECHGKGRNAPQPRAIDLIRKTQYEDI